MARSLDDEYKRRIKKGAHQDARVEFMSADLQHLPVCQAEEDGDEEGRPPEARG